MRLERVVTEQGKQALGPLTVLVVEDEPVVLGLVLRLLRKRGFEAIAAGTAAEAQRILNDGARVDLVLTDFVMPGMNGLELRAWVREHHPAVRVRLMSGHGDLLPLATGPGGEREQILAKPFTAAALVEYVMATLQAPRA